MKNLVIASVEKKSAGSIAGFHPRDTVLEVDGNTIIDEIDFSFYTAIETCTVSIERNGKPHTIVLHRNYSQPLGITFVEPPLKRCGNKCIFCFIDQMPKGLRKSLYIKDEDVMHSFVNGNYVTLSTIRAAELERIIERGLSPLYLSVHATDPAIRKKLLGNSRAPDILPQLKKLSKGGICFHTQIVVCPTFNDGEILMQTIKDLFTFKRSLLSVAIVPVGLTRHRRIELTPFTQATAKNVVDTISKLSDTFLKRDGIRRLFIADELFIKAAIKIPSHTYYQDFPQIENGIGLVRTILDEWKDLRPALVKNPLKKSAPKNIVIATSVSAVAFIRTIFSELRAGIPSITATIIAVPNTFFGESVTVAGLLSGKDTIRALRPFAKGAAHVIIPAVMLNRLNHTLDGYSPQRMSAVLGAPVTPCADMHDVCALFYKQSSVRNNDREP